MRNNCRIPLTTISLCAAALMIRPGIGRTLGADQTDVPALAVLDFADKGPSVRLAPLRIAIAEMLTSDLSPFEGLRIVERIRIAQFLDEHNLRKTGFVDEQNVQQTARSLSADYLLSGSFEATPKQIKLTARLHHVKTPGRAIKVWNIQANPDEFFSLEQQLLKRVREELGLRKRKEHKAPADAPQSTEILSVVGFKNLSPSAKLDPLETGFADALQSQLSVLPGIQLVDRQNLFDVLQEQKLTVAHLADPSQAARIGRLAGADRLVCGFFLEIGDQLRIDVRLVDVKTAAVLGSAMETGPRDSFATMLARLAKRIASEQGTVSSPATDQQLKEAAPARRLESALHIAKADLAFYQANFKAAAEAYERALVVEPDNLHAGLGRLKAWLRSGAADKAIAAGEQALAHSFTPGQTRVKEEIYLNLFSAYWLAAKYEPAVKTADQFLTEFPKTRYRGSIQLSRALGLMYANRRDEGVAALESALREADRKTDPEKYVLALRTLHSYYMFEPSYIQRSREFGKQQSDPAYRKRIAQKTQAGARRAVELHQQLVAEIKDRIDVNSRMWAQSWAVEGLNASCIDQDGKSKLFLEPEQKQKRLKQVVESFENAPKVLYKAYFPHLLEWISSGLSARSSPC